RAEGAERAQRRPDRWGDPRFGPPRQHVVRFSRVNPPPRLGQRDRAAGAGAHGGIGRSPEAEVNADGGGGHVGDQHRQEKRCDARWRPAVGARRLAVDDVDPAERRGECDADPVGDLRERGQPRVRDGFLGGRDRELSEPGGPPHALAADHRERVEAPDLRGDPDRVRRGVKPAEGPDAAPPTEQAGPALPGRQSDRRYRTNPRNDGACHDTPVLPFCKLRRFYGGFLADSRPVNGHRLWKTRTFIDILADFFAYAIVLSDRVDPFNPAADEKPNNRHPPRRGEPAMKVLVIGSGGREHAMAWKVRQESPLSPFCGPGHSGMREIGPCPPSSADAVGALAACAEQYGSDLTLVGPEAPLAAGLVDLFER